MNEAFNKDIAKEIVNADIGARQELPAGSTPRRYEPAQGVKKHNERIHKEAKAMDKYGKLPFTFSKPKKEQSKKLARCTNCGEIKYVNKNTVGVICSTCKTYASVEEVTND